MKGEPRVGTMTSQSTAPAISTQAAEQGAKKIAQIIAAHVDVDELTLCRAGGVASITGLAEAAEEISKLHADMLALLVDATMNGVRYDGNRTFVRLDISWLHAARDAVAKATHLEKRPSTEGSLRSEQCE